MVRVVFAAIVVLSGGWWSAVAHAQSSTPPTQEQLEWIAAVGRADSHDREAVLQSKPDWVNRVVAGSINVFLLDTKPGDRGRQRDIGYGLVALADRVWTAFNRAQSRYLLFLILRERGSHEESLPVLSQAIELAGSTGRKDAVAAFQTAFGDSCLMYLERPKEALVHYRAALGAFKAVSPTSDFVMASLHLNRGLALARTDRPEEAIASYTLALETARPERLVLRAKCTLNIGAVLARQGEYRAAEPKFNEAAELFERANEPANVAGCYANLAAILGEQARLQEADALSARAIGIQEGLKDETGAAGTLANAALYSFRLGQTDRALADLDRASRIFVAHGRNGDAARCALNASAMLAAIGRNEDAIARAELARKKFEELGIATGSASCDLVVASVLSVQGKLPEALRRLEAAKAGFAGAAANLQLADAVLEEADIRFKQGEFAAMRSAAKLALPVYERGGSGPKAARAFQLIGLAEMSMGNLAEARLLFKGAIAARQRLRARNIDPEAASLAAQESRSLAFDIGECELRAGSAARAFEAIQEAKGAVMTSRLESGEPWAGTTGTLGSIGAFASPSTAVLEIVTDGHQVNLLLARPTGKGGVAIKTHRASIPQLAKLVDRFVNSIGSRYPGPDAGLGTLLYAKLFSPLEASLAGVTTLVVCPDGPLHRLPFEALCDKNGMYAIQKWAIIGAPSARAWLACRQLARTRGSLAGRPALVVAVSKYSSRPDSRSRIALDRSSGLDDLPGAATEAALVRDSLSGLVNLLQNERATVGAVKALMPRAGVVHFAVHAIPNDRLSNAGVLVLFPERSGEPGLLYPKDVRSQRLSASLVVLSACGTSEGTMAGGEGLVSMAWSFLVSGCSTTLATRWKVDDEAARRWVAAFYKSLASGKTKSQSFRTATLTLIKDKLYGRPRYWAAWTATGSDF